MYSRFKVGIPSSKKVAFILFNESPLKMLKNVFYFILNVLFVLEIFTVLSRLFGYVQKRFDKKKQPNNRIWSANIL